MKKLISAVAMMLAGTQFLAAQPENDPEAKKILDAVSAKYRSYDIIKADFSYTYNSPSENMADTREGTLYVKPEENKYRIEIGGQEIISDGTTSWIYIKEVNEVQVSRASGNPEELNPSQIFTIHEKGYKYRMKGEGQVDGKPVYLIDLVPLKTSQYSKIEVAVDKNASFVRQLKVFDKSGDHYIYKVTGLTPNPDLKSGFFAFNKASYPGVEVVDLR